MISKAALVASLDTAASLSNLTSLDVMMAVVPTEPHPTIPGRTIPIPGAESGQIARAFGKKAKGKKEAFERKGRNGKKWHQREEKRREGREGKGKGN